MALKPYWQRHPVQLRLAAIIALISFPLVLLWHMVYLLWEDLAEVKNFFKDAWSLIWKGQI